MNILSKAVKWIGASGLVISTYAAVNLYFVFDDNSNSAPNCHQFLNFKHVEICYNLVIMNHKFCPIKTDLE